MCGRTACALAPDDIRKACSFKDKQGRQQTPDWKDAPNGKSYFPSYNIAPGAYTPVLLSSQHHNSRELTSRVIQPMRWGLIPSWHKGTAAEKAFETNNCRAESMLEKQTYKVPLQKGQRCVVLAEGFYEWQREKAAKQPYYIYFPQEGQKHCAGEGLKTEERQLVCVKPELIDSGSGSCSVDVKCEESSSRTDENGNALGNTTGTQISEGETVTPRLLTMAAVFDVWNASDGSGPVYSYSVITVQSSPAMSWIHHRMPAMLTTDQEIEQWLNYGDVPINKASKLIRPVTCVQCHPVSTVVNNSRNNTPECLQKIDPSKPKKSASSNLMMAWLTKGKSSQSGEPPDKKLKR